MHRDRLVASLCLIVIAVTTSAIPAAQPSVESPSFNRDIRPILADKCFQCHGPDSGHRQANLRFDDPESATADREGSPAIVPGAPQLSAMLARITAADPAERMPPVESGKEVTPAEVALLRRWIEQGAQYQPHWSYIPPRRPEVPRVADMRWPSNALDHFVLARLEAEGLSPSPQADPVILVRRLYFDLLGLPPTAEQAEELLNDSSDEAYERLVDRLLDSPHYGERMAIYWLDLVRYADTVGYHGDQEHHISPYRDYVIKSFNDNLPFDQFTVEQLAGDLLPDPTTDQLIATGYNRVLQTTHEGGAQDKEYLAKYAADRVRNASVVWLGATLGCAECHDHKFDPYTQRDFYSFAAFFADIEERGAYPGPDQSPTKRAPEIEVLSPLDRARLETLEQQISDLRAALNAASAEAGDEERGSYEERLAELEHERDAVAGRTRLTMITKSTAPRTMRVLPRGDWMNDNGEVVEPAVPHFLEPLDVTDRRATRLDLARWLTAPDHPQTSRVLANRLWYLFLGAGIFHSLEDSGSQGQWPTHPGLLDWMAVELVESGWDIKHLVKLIVMSSTYRQSSLDRPELRERDPENRLLARQARYRLPAEIVRDNALVISGLLVDRLGGRSARPYQPEGYYAHLNFPQRSYEADQNEQQWRRGVYMHWQRQFVHPMLKAFDAPSREECTAERPISNTPLAALALLNDPTFIEAARVFAARIIQEGGQQPRQRLVWAWRTALSRQPTEQELDLLEALYRRNLDQYEQDPDSAAQLTAIGLAPRPAELELVQLAAWTSVARALLNLNETITRN